MKDTTSLEEYFAHNKSTLFPLKAEANFESRQKAHDYITTVINSSARIIPKKKQS